MSYDNLSSVSQNVLKFYQQLTGEERRIPFIFDNFHFCRSRVVGLDMTENRICNLCRMITWVVFLRMFWNFIREGHWAHALYASTIDPRLGLPSETNIKLPSSCILTPTWNNTITLNPRLMLWLQFYSMSHVIGNIYYNIDTNVDLMCSIQNSECITY